MSEKQLLNVESVSVFAEDHSSSRELLHEISFRVDAGAITAIIGESGSGKTTLTRALTNLFPLNNTVRAEGIVEFDGLNLLGVGEKEMRGIRTSFIRYIFQESSSTLNPTMRIKTQMMYAFRNSTTSGLTHQPGRERDALLELCEQMGINEPAHTIESYPHQLSVGILQRIVIAMAILGQPKLLIADEPTSAVDASQRFQILDLLFHLCKSRDMALLLTTHDLEVARRYADDIIVLYAGRIVEYAAKNIFFQNPLHPYSKILLACRQKDGLLLDRISVLPETTPAADDKLTGCKFYSRCEKAKEDCTAAEPPLTHIQEKREVRCLYWK